MWIFLVSDYAFIVRVDCYTDLVGSFIRGAVKQSIVRVCARRINSRCRVWAFAVRLIHVSHEISTNERYIELSDIGLGWEIKKVIWGPGTYGWVSRWDFGTYRNCMKASFKILIWYFIYIHTLCVQAAKALVSLRICVGSPGHSLLDNSVSTKITCDCQNLVWLPKSRVIAKISCDCQNLVWLPKSRVIAKISCDCQYEFFSVVIVLSFPCKIVCYVRSWLIYMCIWFIPHTFWWFGREIPQNNYCTWSFFYSRAQNYNTSLKLRTTLLSCQPWVTVTSCFVYNCKGNHKLVRSSWGNANL